MDDQTMLAAIDDEAVEPDANDVTLEPAPAADAAEETPEEVAAREAAELAEKREREAREAAERAAADEAAREERAQAAVEKLSKGAGWAAQAGVYYDASHGAVKATSVSAAKSAARPADDEASFDEQTEEGFVADLTDVAINLAVGSVRRTPAFRPGKLFRRVLTMEESESRFYLRLQVRDCPGVIASIAQILADKSISISSLIQHERREADGTVALVILTHSAAA